MTHHKRSSHTAVLLAVTIMAALAFGLVAPVANAQVLYGTILGTVTKNIQFDDGLPWPLVNSGERSAPNLS